MRHNRWSRFLRVVYFTAILAANGSNVRAQSAQPNVTPTFSLSANGMANVQAYQGWALLLEGELSHPNLYSTAIVATPLLINSQNGSWANTIQLVVTDSTGATQNWPIQLATIPPTSLSLDSINVGRLAWVVAPSATSAIAAGTYRIAGILNTTASAGTSGWSGTRNSNPVLLQITAPPASPTALQQEQQAEMLAQYDSLLGNTSQAIQDISALLAQQPNAVGALALQGDLLAQAGQTANALASYDQAVAAFDAANLGPFPEPPVGLLIPQGLLRSQLLSQSGTRGQPQVAIQLLDQGAQSPGVFFLDLQITNVGNDVAENVSLNQITFQTLSGTGQVFYNNVLSPPLPSFTDFLSVNASSSVRIFVSALGTVNGFSVTETGTAADIFGTPVSFTQTQTASLGSNGNLGPLTITANNVNQQYGQPTPPLNNPTYTGFVNGDTPASLTGTLACTTTATQSSPVGTYPIHCSGQSSTSYTIAYVPGTLTITPAPLTVSANPTLRQYGQPNPPFGNIAYNGFVNGDSPGSLTGTLSCTTTATQASPVGTYPVACSGLTSGNYAITFGSSTLTVTPAPLTITANNTTKLLNATNPTFTWTPSGFVNGDTTAVLTSTPICNSAAGANSPVGSYSITCSRASATNYAVTYAAGTLRILYATAIGHSIQPPINADGSSVFNKGRTIPTKFTVYDANGVSIGEPGVVSKFLLTGIQSGTATNSVQDVVDTNNPDNAFRWDPSAQQWIFNITTANLTAGGTYIYTITLNDGSTILFQYGLR